MPGTGISDWSSPCRHESLDISCTLGGAAPATIRGAPMETEADELSEQILAALVDEHGREQEDGSVRAWLRKRRKGPLA